MCLSQALNLTEGGRDRERQRPKPGERGEEIPTERERKIAFGEKEGKTERRRGEAKPTHRIVAAAKRPQDGRGQLREEVLGQHPQCATVVCVCMCVCVWDRVCACMCE